MGKDYTKFNVKNVGENLNKRQVVFLIIEDWINKNNPSFEELQSTFPAEIQGKKGFIVKEADVLNGDYKERYFNLKTPLKTDKETNILISNQWGKGNFEKFLKIAENLGFEINPIEEESNSSSGLIDLNNFSIYKLDNFYNSKEDYTEMEAIDLEIDSLLDQSPKYFLLGKLYEKFGFEYYIQEINDYFTLTRDPEELRELISEESLLSIVIKKENLSDSLISEENTDFILLFAAYFIHALEVLVDTDDNNLIAEFILNQSVNTIKDDYNVETNDDWISDLALDIIKYVYDFNIFDYEGDCEIEGYNLGQSYSMGYDYLNYSQDFIDSMI